MQRLKDRLNCKRGDMQLIAVIMGAKTRDDRNETARNLLDFGFANYGIFKNDEMPIENVKVRCGVKNDVMLYEGEFFKLIPKADLSNVEKIYTIPESISAPINEGEEIGKVEYLLNGEKIGQTKIFSKESIKKISFWRLFGRILYDVLASKK